MVKNTLTASSFRWVALQVDVICNPRLTKTAGGVVWRLQRLPETLTDAYRSILDEVYHVDTDPTEQTIMTHTLHLLMCAAEPLSVTAVTDGLSAVIRVQSGAASSAEVLDICRSLVVINEKQDVFRLSHLSVKEFLEMVAADGTRIAHSPGFRDVDAHASVAFMCLTHIMSETQNTFSRYSINAWGFHASLAGCQRLVGSLRLCLKRFLTSAAFTSWRERQLYFEVDELLGVRLRYFLMTPDYYYIKHQRRERLSHWRRERLSELHVICSFDLSEFLDSFPPQMLETLPKTRILDLLDAICRQDSIGCYKIITTCGNSLFRVPNYIYTSVHYGSYDLSRFMLQDLNFRFTSRLYEIIMQKYKYGDQYDRRRWFDLLVGAGPHEELEISVLNAVIEEDQPKLLRLLLDLLKDHNKTAPFNVMVFATAIRQRSGGIEMFRMLSTHFGTVPQCYTIIVAAANCANKAVEFLFDPKGAGFPPEMITDNIISSLVDPLEIYEHMSDGLCILVRVLVRYNLTGI